MQLDELGFDPFFKQQLTEGDATVARIAAEHRGGYEAWSEVGAGPAQLSGRLARDLGDEATPGVGDWVVLSSPPGPDTVAPIVRVLDRRTVFLRGAAGRSSQGQIVAANVDTVFVVCGLDGDYNLHRIERYLARVWASGAQPVVVLNKADLAPDVEARVAEVEGACMGVPVVATSALQSQGLDVVNARLGKGTTSAFVGSSGAGKSTLINRLAGEDLMATSEVRERDSRGRHTTTHRQLVLLPQGGLLLDTPGMRELQLPDEEGLDQVFEEIYELAAHCRFRDCTHATEPGCAVQEAVADGELDVDRLEHFQRLQAEAQANELRQDERLRRQSERAFSKRISSDLKLVRRFKGDG